MRAFFIGVVIAGGIFGLSMANAVFVDEMVKDNNEELEEDLRRLRARLEEAVISLEHEQVRMREQLEAERVELRGLLLDVLDRTAGPGEGAG